MNVIETIAFDAWPSLEEIKLYGWRIRFSNGCTKRANSANCISENAQLTSKEIEHIESLYDERDLESIFRLTSFSLSNELDKTLASRRYRYIEPSLVMTVPLTASLVAPFSAPFLMSDIEDWVHACEQIAGKEFSDKTTRLQMLQSIKGACAFTISGEVNQALCCGLGVIIDQYIGLFDIETTIKSRGQGFAKRLCSSLMHWGYESGAKYAYLQVLASNSVAIRLYESLGFRRAYHYWYRIKS